MIPEPKQSKNLTAQRIDRIIAHCRYREEKNIPLDYDSLMHWVQKTFKVAASTAARYVAKAREQEKAQQREAENSRERE